MLHLHKYATFKFYSLVLLDSNVNVLLSPPKLLYMHSLTHSPRVNDLTWCDASAEAIRRTWKVFAASAALNE